MKLGLIGVGKMGRQILVRLLKDGHEVVVTARHAETLQEAAGLGAQTTPALAEFVRLLGDRPVVWLMIPAGAVDAQLAALLELLPTGSIVVDGGNSDYRLTLQRAQLAADHQVQLVDAGTSGGILGEQAGFAIMVGGDRLAVEAVAPLFQTLAQPDGWGHFGPTGAGHFTKMVHNAIEYGLMESYAEGYRLLKENGQFPDLDLAKIGQVWQHGSIIASQLNALTADVLSTNPSLGGIDGYVADSGEGRWALEQSTELKLPMPAIEAAMAVRRDSQAGHTHFGTKLLAAMRHAFGGHAVNREDRP